MKHGSDNRFYFSTRQSHIYNGLIATLLFPTAVIFSPHAFYVLSDVLTVIFSILAIRAISLCWC